MRLFLVFSFILAATTLVSAPVTQDAYVKCIEDSPYINQLVAEVECARGDDEILTVPQLLAKRDREAEASAASATQSLYNYYRAQQNLVALQPQRITPPSSRSSGYIVPVARPRSYAVPAVAQKAPVQQAAPQQDALIEEVKARQRESDLGLKKADEEVGKKAGEAVPPQKDKSLLDNLVDGVKDLFAPQKELGVAPARPAPEIAQPGPAPAVKIEANKAVAIGREVKNSEPPLPAPALIVPAPVAPPVAPPLPQKELGVAPALPAPVAVVPAPAPAVAVPAQPVIAKEREVIPIEPPVPAPVAPPVAPPLPQKELGVAPALPAPVVVVPAPAPAVAVPAQPVIAKEREVIPIEPPVPAPVAPPVAPPLPQKELGVAPPPAAVPDPVEPGAVRPALGGLLGEIQAGTQLKKVDPPQEKQKTPEKGSLADLLSKRRGAMLVDEDSDSDSDDEDEFAPDPIAQGNVVAPVVVQPVAPPPPPKAPLATLDVAKPPASPARGALLDQIRGGKALKKTDPVPQSTPKKPGGIADAFSSAIDRMTPNRNNNPVESDDEDDWDDDDDN